MPARTTALQKAIFFANLHTNTVFAVPSILILQCCQKVVGFGSGQQAKTSLVPESFPSKREPALISQLKRDLQTLLFCMQVCLVSNVPLSSLHSYTVRTAFPTAGVPKLDPISKAHLQSLQRHVLWSLSQVHSNSIKELRDPAKACVGSPKPETAKSLQESQTMRAWWTRTASSSPAVMPRFASTTGNRPRCQRFRIQQGLCWYRARGRGFGLYTSGLARFQVSTFRLA